LTIANTNTIPNSIGGRAFTIEEGPEFILSHFPNEERMWPRKIFTKTDGY